MDRKKTSIILADDHTIFRDALKQILINHNNYKIVGEAHDGREVIDIIHQKKPDIVILDISMPKMSGLEVCEYLHKKKIRTKIVILSRHNNYQFVQKAMNSGARAYLLKDNVSEDLIECLENVRNKGIYISKKIESIDPANEKLPIKSNRFLTILDKLSKREKEILKLIARDYNSIDIAKKLKISSRTVDNHRRNIMKKLNIHKSDKIVGHLYKFGLLKD